MVSNYDLISNVSFIFAVLFFIVTVILFITLKIPSVIGDLSGRTARRSVVKLQRRKTEQLPVIQSQNTMPIDNSTALLSEETMSLEKGRISMQSDFRIIKSIIYIHTEESID